jgi:hypothetical protein
MRHVTVFSLENLVAEVSSALAAPAAVLFTAVDPLQARDPWAASLAASTASIPVLSSASVDGSQLAAPVSSASSSSSIAGSLGSQCPREGGSTLEFLGFVDAKIDLVVKGMNMLLNRELSSEAPRGASTKVCDLAARDAVAFDIGDGRCDASVQTRGFRKPRTSRVNGRASQCSLGDVHLQPVTNEALVPVQPPVSARWLDLVERLILATRGQIDASCISDSGSSDGADSESESEDSSWCRKGNCEAPFPHYIELYVGGKVHGFSIMGARIRIKNFLGCVAPRFELPLGVAASFDSVLLDGEAPFSSLGIGDGGRLLGFVVSDEGQTTRLEFEGHD